MIAFVSNLKNIRNTTVPVHFMYLSAWLTKHDIDNNIIEVKETSNLTTKPARYYENKLINKIRDVNPAFVGLSCYTTDFSHTMRLARIIKKNLPAVKIIVGGPHVTLRPSDPFLASAAVDYVIVGEGEFPILALLQRRRPHSRIAGLGWREDDRIKINPPQCLTRDLSHLPMPAYDKIDMKFYLRPTTMGLRFMSTSTIHIFTGLGCPFHCSFCANPGLYRAQNIPRAIRYKTVDQVINELRYLKKKYQLTSFYVQDDTFTLNKKRVHEICDRLISERLDFLWGAETRVNLVDEALIVKMKKAGCRQLDFGVEAATQTALDRIKKGIKLTDVKKIFDVCHRHDVRTGANFMINIPGETKEDVAALEPFMRALKSDVYFLALTVPFLGTEAYDNYVKPPLSIAEYALFENPYLYGTIIDKRFRLARHQFDLEKLAVQLRAKFVARKNLLDFPLRHYYLKYLLKSKYKFAILKTITSNFAHLSLAIAKFVTRRFLNVNKNA